MSDTLIDKLYAAVATDRSAKALSHARAHDACIEVSVVTIIGIQNLILAPHWCLSGEQIYFDSVVEDTSEL